MKTAKSKLACALSAVTCSLLGTPGHAETGDWDIETAVLYCSESDRVTAVEPALSATRDLGDDDSDGTAGYTVQANETPLDPSFEDERIALSLNWQRPLDRNYRSNLGVSFSSETDFVSVSTNALWQHDLNQKNTTLSYGLNLEFDQIEANGGTPQPLINMLDQQRRSGSESREVVDLIMGITQVIDRSSLFQLNLSLGQADGYMTDAYKFVSVVDAGASRLINFSKTGLIAAAAVACLASTEKCWIAVT